MGSFLIIILVVVAVFFVIRWTQTDKLENATSKHRERGSNVFSIKDKNKKISDFNLLFDRTRKEFSEFNVLARSDKIMICEIAKLRGESRELVYVRLTAEPKSVRLSSDGKQLIARYPHVPTKQEMRKDFAQMLNKR